MYAMKVAISGLELDIKTGMKAARHSMKTQFINNLESLTGQQFRGTPGFLIYGPSGELRAQQIGAVPVNLIENFIANNSTTN